MRGRKTSLVMVLADPERARSSSPNRSVFVLPVGSLFFPQREVLKIERETFSPGVVKKVILAAVETKSFAAAEVG